MQFHQLSILRNICFLGAAAWVAVSIYSSRIVPLAEQGKTLERRTGELKEKTAGARRTIRELAQLQRQAARSEAERANSRGLLPDGEVMVWLPQLLQQHFNSFSVSVGVTRLITFLEESDLPGYRRAFWAIGLPGLTGEKAAEGFLLAVADLEKASPFIKVTEAWFRPDEDHPGKFIAAVSLSALARE